MYKKDRLRRSMMFVPGNNPGMIRDARIYRADSIMFDLEDSVAYTEKDAARFLVYNAFTPPLWLKGDGCPDQRPVQRPGRPGSGGSGSCRRPGGSPAQDGQCPRCDRLRAGNCPD